jgi:SAM-dependent methyltransferase
MSLVTGERVVTAEAGFNPTYQRHLAAYRLCAPLLPEGRVLELGCGVGHSFHALAPRESVGVDRSAQALAGQQRETHVADMRALPLPDSSFASALLVQSIEHVPDPERVLAEVVRVLDPGGTALLVTPNRLEFARPEEIIDPYHHVEFDPDELRALCARFFAEVNVLGLFGSARWRELVAEEDRRLHRLLRLDPPRVQRVVPRRARQLVYEWLLTRYRRRRPDPHAGEIAPEDFELRAERVERAFDLIAVCRRPRTSTSYASVGELCVDVALAVRFAVSR